MTLSLCVTCTFLSLYRLPRHQQSRDQPGPTNRSSIPLSPSPSHSFGPALRQQRRSAVPPAKEKVDARRRRQDSRLRNLLWYWTEHPSRLLSRLNGHLPGDLLPL